MKNLKRFDEHTEYVVFTADTEAFIKPNVSYCRLENEVHYNPINPPTPPTPPSPEGEYLTFTALGNGVFRFNAKNSNVLSYSLNGGTWTQLPQGSSISVSSGDTVMWKGNLVPLFDHGDYAGGSGTFYSTTNYKVSGNILSLSWEDAFEGKTTFSSSNAKDIFSYLFADSTTLVSAEDMVLPAMNLTEECYESMFVNCTNMVKGPKELPAVTITGDTAYYGMFSGCTSLTEAPYIAATQFSYECCMYMFDSCTSLVKAPDILAKDVANAGFYHMFYGCSSLNEIRSYLRVWPEWEEGYEPTENWLYGVSSSGTFYLPQGTRIWDDPRTPGVYAFSPSSIPVGWTVVEFELDEETNP